MGRGVTREPSPVTSRSASSTRSRWATDTPVSPPIAFSSSSSEASDDYRTPLSTDAREEKEKARKQGKQGIFTNNENVNAKKDKIKKKKKKKSGRKDRKESGAEKGGEGKRRRKGGKEGKVRSNRYIPPETEDSGLRDDVPRVPTIPAGATRSPDRLLVVSIGYAVDYGRGTDRLGLERCHEDARDVMRALAATGWEPGEVLVLSDEGYRSVSDLERENDGEGGGGGGGGDEEESGRDDDGGIGEGCIVDDRVAFGNGCGDGDSDDDDCDGEGEGDGGRTPPPPATPVRRRSLVERIKSKISSARLGRRDTADAGEDASVLLATPAASGSSTSMSTPPLVQTDSSKRSSSSGSWWSGSSKRKDSLGSGSGGRKGTAAARAVPPTRHNILAALRWLTAGTRDGDTLFLYFAGHGTTVADRSGERKRESGMQGAIVPMDAAVRGLIADECLSALLLRPLVRGSTLYAVMDCCSAGGILDLPYTVQLGGATAENGNGNGNGNGNKGSNSYSRRESRRGSRRGATDGTSRVERAISRLQPIGAVTRVRGSSRARSRHRDRGRARIDVFVVDSDDDDDDDDDSDGKDDNIEEKGKGDGNSSTTGWRCVPLPFHTPRTAEELGAPAIARERGARVGPGPVTCPTAATDASAARRVTRGDVFAICASAHGERSVDADRAGRSVFARHLCASIAPARARSPTNRKQQQLTYTTKQQERAGKDTRGEGRESWIDTLRNLRAACLDGGGSVPGHSQVVQLEISKGNRFSRRDRAFERIRPRKEGKGKEMGRDGDTPPLVLAGEGGRGKIRRKRRVGGG